MLQDKHVTLTVSGSVASYKAAALARELQRAGATVRVVLTRAASRFVTAATFAALTKQPVLTENGWWQADGQIEHIELADWTDLAVAAPATANLMAQFANGLADDVASATWLATAAPKVVVPAMNSHMWQAAATQRNRQRLIADGVDVLQPATGQLAEGYSGQGRFLEPTEIVRQLQALTDHSPHRTGLTGKRVVVTAGGTRERLDPVRFLTNDSSGKMGYAIAEAAQRAGATVTLISAPTALRVPTGVDTVPIESTQDLADAVLAALPRADVVIMAAAVADFTPVDKATQKIKKTKNNDQMTITLKKTPDILQLIAQQKTKQVVVGFAAETQDLIKNGQEKLLRKQLDLLVANDVSRADIGFNGDNNQVTFLTMTGQPEQTPVAPKTQIATRLIERVAALLQQK